MTVTPTATYRLQFRNGMTFDRAVELVPYLRRLGISHLYASPIFTAATGSTHGYDIVDYNAIDPVLGGAEGFERLHAALSGAGVGLILDIVPNHMAASLENRWWHSVVEQGLESPYARHFDIDWTEALTLPILGRPFDEALAAGEFGLAVDSSSGCLSWTYFENRVPLNPASYRTVCERLGIPAPRDVSAPTDQAESARTAIQALVGGRAADDLSKALEALSGDAGFLSRLMLQQHWRLTHWKEARRSLSYRRFFEVTGLVGVRVEDEVVFKDVHALVLSLVRAGKVDGLRVDHVDGLAMPGCYLTRLRQEIGSDRWLLVEKILGEEEHLPEAWPDCGTTGYEFIPMAADLLVDPQGEQALSRAYEAFTGKRVDIAEEARAAKRLMAGRNFEGELMRLALMAADILSDGSTGGLNIDALRCALVEILAGFGVYRTYGEGGALSWDDRLRLDDAVRDAASAGAAGPDALRAVAELIAREPAAEETTLMEFRLRFQQLSGPVMAKSVEDTLFYRVNPLIALNEVGATPGRGGGDVQRFHRAMEGQTDRPLGLLATATHDTKRGEDARARLYALSELPDEWGRAVQRWSAMNAHLRTPDAGSGVPEPEVEWLLYQMIAGAWPPGGISDAEALAAFAARMAPAVEKSLREAKLRTDWIAIDDVYEAQVAAFLGGLLSPDSEPFIADFSQFVSTLDAAATVNSLSQTLAKLTGQGIPDIYQGSERGDFSLVDPDNRRHVDFDMVSSALDDSRASAAETAGPGDPKHRMIADCLTCRRAFPALFSQGRYEAVRIEGKDARHHVAFLREHGDDVALVLLSRLMMGRVGRPSEAFLHLPERLHGRVFRGVLRDSGFSGSGELAVAPLLHARPTGLWIASRAT